MRKTRKRALAPKRGPAGPLSRRLSVAFEEVSSLTKAVDAGSSAAVAVGTYYALVPEQLSLLHGGALMTAALGVIASWMAGPQVRRHAVKAVAAAVLLLLTLVLLNVSVVEKVQYQLGNQVEPIRLLVGTHLSSFGEEVARQVGGAIPAEMIRAAGRDQIPEMWTNYYAIAFTYVICFMLFTFCAAVAIGSVVEHIVSRRTVR